MPSGTSRKYYVYVISDPRKEGPFKYGEWTAACQPIYVGMGSGKRHINTLKSSGNNPYKTNKMHSIRRSGHEPILRFARTGLSLKEAYALEIKLIAAIGRRTAGGPLTNLTRGGEGVVDPSPSTIKKMRASAIVRGIQAEQRAKITASLRGKTFTDEQRANMRAGCLRRGSYGALNEEHKQKLSAALKGRKKPPRTQEHIDRISEAKTKYRVTYKGRTQSLMNWCRELDLKYTTTNMRIYTHGWSIKDAFTIPVGQRRSN